MSMNQGKLEVVRQDMARVSINILVGFSSCGSWAAEHRNSSGGLIAPRPGGSS